METISFESVNRRFRAQCEVLAVSDFWIVGEGWGEAAPPGTVEQQVCEAARQGATAVNLNVRMQQREAFADYPIQSLYRYEKQPLSQGRSPLAFFFSFKF
ncbi:hypothetical protein [Salmonirosea aquatica]|uniref:Uncharacterized protein n=1 Tax=Salmonirosea aquatica TaxID=2654236 RepID=A0A7C9FBG9_9BACT|nr:hypothetical protein [Cytophagaceae bacterium SJW1-29]